MGSLVQSEVMREKRAESLVRNPRAVASTGEAGSDEKKFEGRKKHPGACRISVDRITPDANQPRTEFDPEALERLAASLKARGQLQPIRVRWAAESAAYVIVVGERRWRAAMEAGMETLDCIVIEGDLSPEDLLEDQLVENAIREDLKPIEQARSYRLLMEARGLTHRDLAERLNVAHTTVTRALGLLELPESVQAQVDSDAISATTAYAIATGLDDPEAQREVAERVISEKLSRAETVEVVRQKAKAGGGKSKAASSKKSRGPGKGKVELPTERTLKTAVGIKVVASARKGFDVATWIQALEDAVRQAREKLDPGDDQAAA
jgi:ParB family transcriptional regulator, chromosome partitioning protein